MVTGHTAAHSAIKGNVAVALDEALSWRRSFSFASWKLSGSPRGAELLSR
jgi:hypothetical protein